MLPQLEHFLDEWSTGSQIKENVTESDDKDVYEKHLKRLKNWESVDPVVTKNLRNKLFKRLVYVPFHTCISDVHFFLRKRANAGAVMFVSVLVLVGWVLPQWSRLKLNLLAIAEKRIVIR
jgi:hypothetical protein